jgi:low temperature requirement protein LtrA
VVEEEQQRTLDEQEREQQELVRPPDVNQASNRTATRLELFYDLAFVLFVAGCADVLAHDETPVGGLRFAALLTIGWWAWASSALYANRFDTDDTVFRLLTLGGMGGVVAMAASVDDLGGAGGRWFAAGYVALRVVLVLGYLRAWRHVPRARSSIRPYLVGHSLGGACWLASIAVPTPGRYVLWAVGLLVDVAGPTLAARQKGGAPLHVEHLPERFALFVILVLGESVAAVVTGLHDGGWTAHVTGAALLGLVVAACLWWVYFDLAGGAAKRELVEEDDETGGDTRQGVHDVYVYLHLPITVSLAAVAVGLEYAVLHAGDEGLPGGPRWVLSIGVSGYLLSSAVIQAAMSRGARGPLLWPGAGVPTVLAIAWLNPAPLVVLGLTAAVLLAGLAAGIAEHRGGWVRTAKV